jgi:hypothetical protein
MIQTASRRKDQKAVAPLKNIIAGACNGRQAGGHSEDGEGGAAVPPSPFDGSPHTEDTP